MGVPVDHRRASLRRQHGQGRRQCAVECSRRSPTGLIEARSWSVVGLDATRCSRRSPTGLIEATTSCSRAASPSRVPVDHRRASLRPGSGRVWWQWRRWCSRRSPTGLIEAITVLPQSSHGPGCSRRSPTGLIEAAMSASTAPTANLCSRRSPTGLIEAIACGRWDTWPASVPVDHRRASLRREGPRARTRERMGVPVDHRRASLRRP